MKKPFGKRDMRRKRRQDKERKGGAIPGPVSTAPSQVGVRLAPAAGAASSGGSQLSAWNTFAGAFARATGLSGQSATAARMALVVIAVTTGAVSIYLSRPRPSAPLRQGRHIFAPKPASPFDARVESEPAPLTPAQRVASGSSLDYFADANPIDAVAGTAPAAAEEETGEAREAPAADDAADKEPAGDAPAASKPPADKPRLIASSKIGTGGGQLTSNVALKTLQDMKSHGGDFAEIYKKPGAASGEKAGKRTLLAASRRTAGASGSNAYGQAKFANRMSGQAAKSAASNSAAAYASQPFDGANTLGGSGAATGEGAALGGAGVETGASSIKDTKEIEEPPKPEDVKTPQNQTPYQGMLIAATAALMIGLLLLKLAGELINQAKADPTGVGAAAKLAQGKMLAMAAMAAGGAAAGLGGMIAGQFGQLTQAIPFILGGGALAAEAGMVIIKADQAGKDAGDKINDGAGQAGGLTSQALSPDRASQNNLEPERKLKGSG
ncbi:MAG: hypothetical protein ABIJ96_03385 [Elusimicrobiota bacterium]